MATIKGHSTYFKVIKNGDVVGIADLATNFEVHQDSSFMRSFYVGKKHGVGDQTFEGWSGSFDVEVKDASVDEFIDSIVNNNLDGIGADEIQVVDTEEYLDGTTKSYVYFGCLFKMSKRGGTHKEKVTKKLDFQADGRQAL